MNSKTIGTLSEAKLLSKLVSCGYTVYIPFGENTRTDLIIEDSNGKLSKVQIKHGVFRHGAVQFRLQSVSYAQRPKGYKGQVDYFGVYCTELDTCYLIPIEVTKNTVCNLRVTPAKNNQTSIINLAEDYILEL